MTCNWSREGHGKNRGSPRTRSRPYFLMMAMSSSHRTSAPTTHGSRHAGSRAHNRARSGTTSPGIRARSGSPRHKMPQQQWYKMDLQHQTGHLDWHTVCGHKSGEHTGAQGHSYQPPCLSAAQKGTACHSDFTTNLGLGRPHQAGRPMVYCSYDIQLGPS